MGASSRTPKILMVDDQARNLLALAAVLETLGAELIKVNSGEEALRRVLGENFDLILLDVHMPGIDGFETAKLMRNHHRSKHIPIIFISAVHTSDADVSRGLALGASDYMIKPFVPEILRAKVKSLIATAAA